MKLPDLIRSIDAQRQDSNLSSAIRLLVLEFYRSQIPDRADFAHGWPYSPEDDDPAVTATQRARSSGATRLPFK
jgi:predicted DNA-binding ribbon-helix-helix protein